MPRPNLRAFSNVAASAMAPALFAFGLRPAEEGRAAAGNHNQDQVVFTELFGQGDNLPRSFDVGRGRHGVGALEEGDSRAMRQAAARTDCAPYHLGRRR